MGYCRVFQSVNPEEFRFLEHLMELKGRKLWHNFCRQSSLKIRFRKRIISARQCELNLLKHRFCIQNRIPTGRKGHRTNFHRCLPNTSEQNSTCLICFRFPHPAKERRLRSSTRASGDGAGSVIVRFGLPPWYFRISPDPAESPAA